MASDNEDIAPDAATPAARLADVAFTEQPAAMPTEQLDDRATTASSDAATSGATDTAADATIPTLNLDGAATTSGPAEPPAANRYSPYAPGTTVPRPRIRSGAIAWGVIVLAFAAAVLLITAVPGNASAFAAWTAALTPAAYGVIVVVTIGVLVLLFAGLSAIRRAQRRTAARG